MLLQLISASQVRAAREHIIRRLLTFADDVEAGDPKATAKARDLDVTAGELRKASEMLQAEAEEEKKDPRSNEAAYIPSSPLTCMLQSTLEEEARERGFVEPESGAEGLAEGEVPLTSEKLQHDKIDVLGLNGEDAKQGLSVGDMQDGEDIRYIVDGALGVAARLIFGKHQFNTNPAKTAALGDDARVMLFGDWASGLDRARDLAVVMGKMVINDDPKRTQHLLHLGDTYYAGRTWEYETRFLPHWPDTEGRAETSWSLNGNHDMYAGGKGYFVTLLQHPTFRSHRAVPQSPESASSFFLLENDHWQIFGLDSAYFSPELRGMNGAIDDSQAKFVKEKLNTSKRVILLTHHQLFSARPGEGNSTQIKNRLVEAGVWPHIDAWLWGHEHRCVIYDRSWTQQHHGLPFGLCLGNSGVPVKDEPVEMLTGVEWEYTESFDFTATKRLRQFAFASLLFDSNTPKKVKVIIYDWKGRPVKEVEI